MMPVLVSGLWSLDHERPQTRDERRKTRDERYWTSIFTIFAGGR
jgi:hypothetical protein